MKRKWAHLKPFAILLFAFGNVAYAQVGLKPSSNPQIIGLDEAIHLAEQENKDLLIAKEQIEQQKARLRRSYSLYLPRLELGGTYTFNFPEISQTLGATTVGAPSNQKPITIVIQPQSVFDAKLTLSQNILNLNALATIRNSNLELDRLEASCEKIRSSIYMDVTRAYFQAIRGVRATEVAQNNVKRAQALLKRAQQKYRLGLVRKSDAQRLELEVVKAKTHLYDTKASNNVAIANLGLLFGAEESFLINTQIPVRPIEKLESVDNLIINSKSARQDLQLQRAALEVAKKTHEGVYSNFFPIISVVGQGFYTSNTSGFVTEPFRGAIVLQASWLLYDGGDRYGQLRETRSQIRLEEIKLRDNEVRIDSEIRGRIHDIENKLNTLASTDTSLRLQRSIFSDAQKTYRQGLVDLTELINASHELTSLELAKGDAGIDVDLARLDLANVVGRLSEAID